VYSARAASLDKLPYHECHHCIIFAIIIAIITSD